MYNRSRNTVHNYQVKDGTYRTYTGLSLKGSSREWLVSYESRSLQPPSSSLYCRASVKVGEGELVRRRTGRLASRALRRGGTVDGAGRWREFRVRLGFLRGGDSGLSDGSGSLRVSVCGSLYGRMNLRFLRYMRPDVVFT